MLTNEDFLKLGQECVFGSYDHIRLFSYQPRKGMFEEAPMKEIRNMYTVTGMAWSSGKSLSIINENKNSMKTVL